MLASRGDDRGFTLLEMMIAVLIIAVVFTPLASVFWSGLRTADASTHRTSGFSIASKEIEALHAVPYAQLGFYSDQTPAQWQYTTTVILGSCSTTCTPPFTPLVKPTATTVSEGLTYHIARYVYWDDAIAATPPADSTPSTTVDSQAYKGVTVVVSWTDQVGSHSVQQDSIIYPGGQGTYQGPGSGTTTTTTAPPVSAPAAPAAVAPVAPQPAAAPATDGQEIDVTISPGTGGGTAQAFYLQYSTSSTFAVDQPVGEIDQPVMANTLVQVQGLAPQTAYYFRAYALNTVGQSPYSPIQGPDTTPAATTTPSACTLGSFTISTVEAGKTYLSSDNTMSEDVGLSLNVSGGCSQPITVASIAPGGTPDAGSQYTLTQSTAGGQWGTTIPSLSSAWAVGTHNLTVYVGGTSQTVSDGLLVCAYGSGTSLEPTSC